MVCFLVINKLYFRGNWMEIRCFIVILKMFVIDVVNERNLRNFEIFMNVMFLDIFCNCVS